MSDSSRDISPADDITNSRSSRQVDGLKMCASHPSFYILPKIDIIIVGLAFLDEDTHSRNRIINCANLIEENLNTVLSGPREARERLTIMERTHAEFKARFREPEENLQAVENNEVAEWKELM